MSSSLLRHVVFSSRHLQFSPKTFSVIFQTCLALSTDMYSSLPVFIQICPVFSQTCPVISQTCPGSSQTCQVLSLDMSSFHPNWSSCLSYISSSLPDMFSYLLYMYNSLQHMSSFLQDMPSFLADSEFLCTVRIRLDKFCAELCAVNCYQKHIEFEKLCQIVPEI